MNANMVRNRGFDVLRFLCMIMLSTYHFMNCYGSVYTDIDSYGFRAIAVQNFFWGGGRMICNVFLFISAWFLCERYEFRIERVLRVVFTVWIYSLPIGIVFYYRTRETAYLISHLFPISTNLLWYATMYVGILILSPMLNRLLDEKNRETTKTVCIVFFIALCVIPTFYPKYTRLGSDMSWFMLAYLIVGLMKAYGFMLNRFCSLLLFFSGMVVMLVVL